MDWIYNNLLALCAIILPILVTIGIVIYQRILNRKRLSYEIVYSDEIVRSNIGYDDLKFVYQGVEINDLYLLTIRVINDGRKEISSADFESSLRFDTGQDVKILNLKLVKKKPVNIEIDISKNNSSVTIKPTLLNSKDEFEFQLLITNSSQLNLEANARIKGISSITKTKKTLSQNRVYHYVGSFVLIFFYGLIIDFSNNNEVFSKRFFLFISLFSTITISYFLLEFFYNRRRR